MNEKIKLLAEQAGINFYKKPVLNKDYPELYDGVYCESELEQQQKFAELIIKECAKFLDENSGYDCFNNVWHPEPEDLLKHFGVEECSEYKI